MDNEKPKDNPAQKNPAKDKADCNFIYFIDAHEKTKHFKIYLPGEYQGADSLEKLQEQNVTTDLNDLSSIVYRFKIIPGALEKDKEEKYQILILADDTEGNKYQCAIKFSDETKDFYVYDFNLEEINYKYLSHEKQFEIYVDILRKTLKKTMITPENENLISCTNELVDEKDKKINFFFYLLIFFECFSTKYVQQHLLKFTPEKIEGLGTFPANKKKFINTLNIIKSNPDQKLNLKDAKDKEELIELFYSVLLYFNIHFQEKQKVFDLFKDEKTLTYLSKKLISLRKFYQDLILPQEIVRSLIKKSKTFKDILGYLPYIGNDIIELIKLIHLEIDFISKIYKEELDKINEENENLPEGKKKEIDKIDIEKYVVPKKNDDIKKLFEIIGLIFTSQNMNKIHLIKISNSLIGKYVNFYYENNLDNLQLINHLIIMIKKDDQKFEFKYDNKDMDLIIHETGIKLIKAKAIKNISILEFIKSDIFFTSDEYKKIDYRPLEVFDGIDIETLDDKFFIIWHKMNFKKMYSKNMDKFNEKILSLIKDMKDFGLLYQFFLFNNEKEYSKDNIIMMKKKYLELFPTYNAERSVNFVEDTIKLISLADAQKIDLKDLLEHIQNNLDFDKVNDL